MYLKHYLVYQSFLSCSQLFDVKCWWYNCKYRAAGDDLSLECTNHHTNLSLTHWGRVTHICVGKLTIIGSDNGLSPERRQAIIWANAAILLIGPLGTNFNEILIEIQTFSLEKIRLKMSSAKCCSFRLGLNVLMVSINDVVKRTDVFS